MANDLSELLRNFLPEHVFSSVGTSCSERRHRVSFQRESDDDLIYYLDIKSSCLWQNTPSCDGLFVCSRKGRDDFLVLLVELKGDDTRKAFEQLLATGKQLCKGSAFPKAGHGKAKAMSFAGEDCPRHPRGMILATIASRSGGNAAPNWQDKEKQLLRQRIKLVSRVGISCTVGELYKKAGLDI